MTDLERERIADSIEASTNLLANLIPASKMTDLEVQAFRNLADMVRTGYYAERART